METSLLVFAAAVIGSAIGPLVTALLNLRTARMEREAVQRKERLEYLDGKLQHLIELRGELQWYQQNFSRSDMFGEKAEERRETSYGKAYGIMMSIDEDVVQAAAMNIMEKQEPQEKLSAIDFAIKHLAGMTMKIVRDD